MPDQTSTCAYLTDVDTFITTRDATYTVQCGQILLDGRENLEGLDSAIVVNGMLSGARLSITSCPPHVNEAGSSLSRGGQLSKGCKTEQKNCWPASARAEAGQQDFSCRDGGVGMPVCYASICLTRALMALPSAFPASSLVAAPITLPMSLADVAPVRAMMSFSAASSSSGVSCLGR